MIKFVQGDMFSVDADILINTVNCVGVMGKGIALAFKHRYPKMFNAYTKSCRDHKVRPGSLDVWKTSTEWIINFPTKRHWRDSSRYEDVEAGLASLRDYLKDKPDIRVAMPALGCGHGGLDWKRISAMISDHLADLHTEIFVFSPMDSRRH